jgi:21S rRNA (uridine2791-2'-O)-methyltransferase
MAALEFCYTTLATGGHFLTKYYMGSEDQVFEKRLKRLFHKVHRIKPDSSRKESKEAYFLAINRKAGIPREAVLGDLSAPPSRQSKGDPNDAQANSNFEWHQ